MGTRGLVHIKDGRKTLATIYRQYDCYPTGMGNDIKELLNNGNVTIVNGYNSSMKSPSHFNGVMDLGAYLISALKTFPNGVDDFNTIGNVYLQRPNESDVGEEYTYTISVKDDKVWLKVLDVYRDKVLFNNWLSVFDGKVVERLAS